MHKQLIKITFIIPSLSAGGAERILSFIAQNLNTKIFYATLLVIGFEKDKVYDLGNLNVTYLNKPRVLTAVPNIIKYFRKNKPNIVVSSIVHLNTIIALLSLFFPRTKFVAREANVLSVLKKYNNDSKVYFPKFLIVFAYKLVDRLICQSKDMQKDMIDNYKVSRNKTILINNPITNTFSCKEYKRDSTKPIKFITVARLSKEKGHDRIIEALSKLDFPFHYTIIGDGNEKEILFQLVEAKGLTPSVTHIPYTKEIEKHLKKNDVFLQGSYSEGFPNALIESCVVGTPILAFNAPGGLNEIIENGINGQIVNDEDEFIEQLKNLNLNFYYNPLNVRKVVAEKFNKEKIISQYESIFSSLVN